MATLTRAEKAADRRIDKVYRENCANIQVDMMDIPRIFGVGREAIKSGVDDDGLKTLIVAFVQSVRKN